MQRYFITAESTYEDLRQSLNAQLGYPNAAAKTVFQTALQAPRDSFRRVLLAVDTDLASYATIDAAIAPLLDSDAMEEIDEATYLAAVASASSGGGGGVSSWNDLTDTPTSFSPSAHKASHSTGGSDALSPSDIGAASSSHTHAASDIVSGTIGTARLGSGTANSTTFLRGDGSWATAGSTSASDLSSGTLSDLRLSNNAQNAINLYLWSSLR